MTSKMLAKKIALSALTKKASNIAIMDLRKLTTMTDFFVICSADSDTQVKAIADAIREGAREVGESVWKNEGYSDASWILLDYVNVVAHVFHKQTRDFYNLEKLWGDAKVEYVTDNGSDVKPSSSRRIDDEEDESPVPVVKKTASKSSKKTTAASAVKKPARPKKKKADTEE
ncbi:MAG TPA: ribosome silencing factor [Bacteroidota bacterium]|nr:ribosome silencing factor [Bacteroidota bacterium]